jgi:hypothetical protein
MKFDLAKYLGHDLNNLDKLDFKQFLFYYNLMSEDLKKLKKK